jgi:predicted metal-dependent hydrolase
MVVGGVTLEVVRKKIRNLQLGVYPPHGRVRVAAPLDLSDEAVRLALAQKLGWIKRQRRGFEGQARLSARAMVNGETHHYAGCRYRLRVREQAGMLGVALSGDRMELFAPVGSSSEVRVAILAKCCSDQLRFALTPLIEKWQRRPGVKVAA